MLLVKVYGLPVTTAERLSNLKEDIVTAVIDIQRFGNQNMIACLFISEMSLGSGSRIIVELVGTWAKHLLAWQTAKDVGSVICKAFPDARVECIAYPSSSYFECWSNKL